MRMCFVFLLAGVISLAPFATASETPGCDLSRPPIATDGVRRLALLVGVGEYKSETNPDLQGPPQDVRAVYELLTGPGGYGFAPQNVCVLLDEDATVAGFLAGFKKALIERARPGAGDIAVLYYAGHGSQARDRNGDEPDGVDETLVLHDSRTGGVGDLLDDELNILLASLHERTRDITVIFDSCNSGSATRGERDDAVPRLVPSAEPLGELRPVASDDSDTTWIPPSLPGLVVLSAAKDGTSALEPRLGGHGYFTAALLKVLGEVSEKPLTWAQVSRRMPKIVATLSKNRQLPTFQGELDRNVLSNAERSRPLSWEITETGRSFKLSGIDMPGWGVGAELRVYPGNAQRGDTKDPAKAKATLRITRFRGLSATATLVDAPTTEIRAGDLAVLMLPSPQALALGIRLRQPEEAGGITAASIEALEKVLAENPAIDHFVDFTDATDAFTLGTNADGELELRGPEGVARNTWSGSRDEQVRDAIESLGQHARQSALLMLEGETGSDFENDETLEVRVVPVADEPCALEGWVAAGPNEEQRIPLCSTWQIEVRNTHDAITLLVGGAVLWNDGGIFGIPAAGEEFRLPPGKTALLDPGAARFQAVPPLDALEHLVIFGTREDNPINWSVVTDPAKGSRGDEGPLQAVLAGYMGGTRGGRQRVVAKSTWTSSHVPIRVVADFEIPDGEILSDDLCERVCSAETASRDTPPPPPPLATGELPLPEFPWPPPEPSSRMMMPRSLLGLGDDARFKDVWESLHRTLLDAGYLEQSVYSVPDGFAIATQPERLLANGEPDPENRWSLDRFRPVKWSLLQYLRALVTVDPGRFRVFVFAVTTDHTARVAKPVSSDMALKWVRSGALAPPPSLLAQPLRDEHAVHVLVYELSRPNREADIEQVTPAELSVQVHLRTSGVLGALEEKP